MIIQYQHYLTTNNPYRLINGLYYSLDENMDLFVFHLKRQVEKMITFEI